jgi:hypothetical protein
MSVRQTSFRELLELEQTAGMSHLCLGEFLTCDQAANVAAQLSPNLDFVVARVEPKRYFLYLRVKDADISQRMKITPPGRPFLPLTTPAHSYIRPKAKIKRTISHIV